MDVATAVHISTCTSLSSYVWVLQPGSLIAGLKPAIRAEGGKLLHSFVCLVIRFLPFMARD
jgi:hypothetical protein